MQYDVCNFVLCFMYKHSYVSAIICSKVKTVLFYTLILSFSI
jgi:hypothetical protein